MTSISNRQKEKVYLSRYHGFVNIAFSVFGVYLKTLHEVSRLKTRENMELKYLDARDFDS